MSLKSILFFLSIVGFAAGAVAQSEPSTSDMTCAQAAGLVASQGAVVLRTGPATYDRYVRDARYCAVQEMARPAWVRTADAAQCQVGRVCRSIEIDNGQ
jgi:hypothetical protein